MRCAKLLVALVLFIGSGHALCWAKQPNIVLLIADDLGYGELGCYSSAEIPTPQIDSLAVNGIRFTQGYVTAPNCSPSRAGLFTGKIPTRFGYEFNPIGAKNDDPKIGLPTDQRTIANVLHDAGYVTGLIGKWHLGGGASFHPQRRGFDDFFGFLHEGHFYVPAPWDGVTTMLRRRSLPGGGTGRWSDDRLILSTHMDHDEPPYDANNPLVRGSQPVAETAHLTEAFTREATEFIGRNRNRPFFLTVAYNAVHSPLQASQPYLTRFEHIADIHRRIFAAMLAQLDEGVGTILRKLREEKLDHNTLVIFLSDNGGPTRELTSRNNPLRGEKGDLYEGGIRVPWLVQWPARYPRGKIYRQPVSTLDLLQTFSVAADGLAPDNGDGVDLTPHLIDETQRPPHQHLYWKQGPKTAIRVGDWKLIRMPRGARARSMPDWELYDLANDPSESMNQAAEQKEKVTELRALWEKLDAEMAEPLF